MCSDMPPFLEYNWFIPQIFWQQGHKSQNRLESDSENRLLTDEPDREKGGEKLNVYLYCKEYGFNDNITMYEFGVVTVDCLSDAQDQLFEAGSGLANQLGQVGLAQVCRDDYFEHRHHHLNVGSIVHVHL